MAHVSQLLGLLAETRIIIIIVVVVVVVAVVIFVVITYVGCNERRHRDILCMSML